MCKPNVLEWACSVARDKRRSGLLRLSGKADISGGRMEGKNDC